MIFQQRLSGSEKASSDYVERMYKIATQQLDNIENGRIRLRGQDSYTASRTVKSDLWVVVPRINKEQAQTTG
jgi:ribosomal 50S subunit-recycling heat shock protein